MTHTLSRVLTAFAFAAATGLGRAGEPTDQIRQTTDQILAIVQDPALQGDEHVAERERRMKLKIDARFDWPAMARSAMGRHWAGLNEAQRQEFTGLFSDLIKKTYLAQLESYTGEKILYQGDRVDGKYGVANVTVVTLRGTDIPVNYRMLRGSAEWQVYDVSIEGVSLVNNYRSQISALFDRYPYDGLITRIKSRLATPDTETGGSKSAHPAYVPGRDNL